MIRARVPGMPRRPRSRPPPGPIFSIFSARSAPRLRWQPPFPGVVVASDVTLERLSETISRHRMTASSEVALVGADGKVLAYRDPGKLVRSSDEGKLVIAGLPELGSEVLAHLAGDVLPGERSLDFEFQGRRWIGSVRKVASPGGVDLFALMVAPVDELLSEAVRMRWQSVMITGLIILLAIPVVWLVARKISRPLHQLAGEAGLISRFDFGSPIHTRSFISEVDELAVAMGLMKTTISRFLTLINSLAGERNFDALLEGITRETMSVSEADGVLTYLVDEDGAWLAPGTLQLRGQGRRSIEGLPRFAMTDGNALVSATRGKESRLLRLRAGEQSGLEPLLQRLDARALNLIALPLRNRQDVVIGVLCLLFRDEDGNNPAEPQEGHIAFVRALSGFRRGLAGEPSPADDAAGAARCVHQAHCRRHRLQITLYRRSLPAGAGADPPAGRGGLSRAMPRRSANSG